MKAKKAAQSILQTSVMLPLFCFLLCLCLCPSTAADSPIIARPGCADTCGDVSVPYPFGIDELRCAKNESFLFSCDRTSSPHTLIFNETIPILNISVQTSKMIGEIDSAFDCYDGSNGNHTQQSLNLAKWPFTISGTDNRFTAVGCDTFGIMYDRDNGDATFASGCISLCNETQKFTKDSNCSGVGCCQTTVPMHLKFLSIDLISSTNHTTLSSFSPCSYAFLVEVNSLDLSETRLKSKRPVHLSPPVVLDWVVFGDSNCAGQCSVHADCRYSKSGGGYVCSCKNGYEGNPYLPTGCQDINECEKPDEYTCHGSCKNADGDYICSCPIGMYGDGKDSCQGFGITTIVAVIGAIILLAIISLLIFVICNKRKRQNNFLKNGGELLKNQRVRIFSEAELETATKSYDKDRLLGEGGFGYVYKGVLEDGTKTAIAVKKPKDENKIQISTDFWHEMTTVSQINHKNVVKLLGLCLETKVPFLVYEFISNGKLFEHIHNKRSSLLLSWKNRLRVASETAFALDYLHSAADPPIIHSDVKSMNVLIDENHTAKVSDFGASVLISPGETALATKIQGTLGYLDPEYLMTGILTEKSDVYSFGVLLVELLTGEKPTSDARSGEKRNIVQYFISTAENDSLFEILGFDVGDEGEREEIQEVAVLAKRCLNANGIIRPTMKEVADDLARLKKLNESLWAHQNGTQETQHLLGESLYYSGENAKAEAQMGQPNSYTFASFDVGSSISIGR